MSQSRKRTWMFTYAHPFKNCYSFSRISMNEFPERNRISFAMHWSSFLAFSNPKNLHHSRHQVQTIPHLLLFHPNQYHYSQLPRVGDLKSHLKYPQWAIRNLTNYSNLSFAKINSYHRNHPQPTFHRLFEIICMLQNCNTSERISNIKGWQNPHELRF